MIILESSYEIKRHFCSDGRAIGYTVFNSFQSSKKKKRFLCDKKVYLNIPSLLIASLNHNRNTIKQHRAADSDLFYGNIYYSIFQWLSVDITSQDDDVRVIMQSGPLAVQTYIGSTDSKLCHTPEKQKRRSTAESPNISPLMHKVWATDKLKFIRFSVQTSCVPPPDRTSRGSYCS